MRLHGRKSMDQGEDMHNIKKSPKAELALQEQVRLDGTCSLRFGPLKSNQVECWHPPWLGILGSALFCLYLVRMYHAQLFWTLPNCRFQILFTSFRSPFTTFMLLLVDLINCTKFFTGMHEIEGCFPRYSNGPLQLSDHFIVRSCLIWAVPFIV